MKRMKRNMALQKYVNSFSRANPTHPPKLDYFRCDPEVLSPKHLQQFLVSAIYRSDNIIFFPWLRVGPHGHHQNQNTLPIHHVVIGAFW